MHERCTNNLFHINFAFSLNENSICHKYSFKWQIHKISCSYAVKIFFNKNILQREILIKPIKYVILISDREQDIIRQIINYVENMSRKKICITFFNKICIKIINYLKTNMYSICIIIYAAHFFYRCLRKIIQYSVTYGGSKIKI